MPTSAIPIDELTILPFEGMPALVVQALAEDLAAHGVSPRVDPPVPLPQAAYAPDRQVAGVTTIATDAQRDCYDVLGVPCDATEKQIKDAFRVLTHKYHPAGNKEPG